jgi:nitrate/nitrite transport system permease protein
MVFKAADPASTWTIFICSIWPMILNTAQGVQRVPQDYLNVARVLNLSEFKIITKILFPPCCPTCSPASACPSAPPGWSSWPPRC